METNETEQLEKKVNWNKAARTALIGLTLYGISSISIGCNYRELSKRPSIYQEYENAQTSLQNARQMVTSEVLFPYKNIELKQVIDENYSRWDETIESLERDIGKMEDLKLDSILDYMKGDWAIMVGAIVGTIATIFGGLGLLISTVSSIKNNKKTN